MRFRTALILLLAASTSAADVLLSQDFEGDSIPGWRDSGSGTLKLTTYAGNTSLRLTRKKAVTLSLSTAGFEDVAVSMQLAGGGLGKSASCHAEASTDAGKRWISVVEVTAAEADGVTLHSGRLAIPGLSNNPQLRLRFRANGKHDNEYCWGDNVRITGYPVAAAAVSLDDEFLFGAERMRRPLRMAAFAVPPDAVAYTGAGTGRLKLSAEQADGFDAVLDRFDYQRNEGAPLAVFPAAVLEWVQADGFVIPLDESVQRLAHPNWEIAFQPGGVWRASATDDGLRYSLPFALVERNANCTHNGVMTWAVDGDGRASRVAYQIASETCAYLKFDMWGTLRAEFALHENVTDPQLIDVFREHRERQLPVRPLASLTELRDGIDASMFSAVANMDPADSTVSGLVVDGRHYRSDCPTRHGPYPFCDEILLPSFSLAKSIFGGLALMRLEAIEPGAAKTTVASLLPDCAQAGWGSVTIGNALDLATGRYVDKAVEADESLPEHVGFLYADTHREKIDFACRFFPKKAEPGTVWAYHSSDTYVAGAAMRALLQRDERKEHVDLYRDLVVEPLWSPLELGAAIRSTRTTYDPSAHALVGWGLSFQPDDIARIGAWLQAGAPLPGGVSIDKALFDGAMQRNPGDRGLPAGAANVRYNNGFWGFDIAEFIACDKPVWVPFMSGHGGISVVMFPNDTVFYHFTDGYVYRWREAAVESNKIRNMCP